MYRVGDPTDAVYLVLKGEFELSRKLERSNLNQRRPYIKKEEDPIDTQKNVLAARMPEIKDFPYTYRLNILEIGSLAGEEDCFKRKAYTSSLICYTEKGTVYRMEKENFKRLRQTEQSWINVM